jgi:hypothetical protein
MSNVIRYVHYIAESPEYIRYSASAISSMGGFFNWSMCNKRDADFWRPDGRIIQVSFPFKGTIQRDFLPLIFSLIER